MKTVVENDLDADLINRLEGGRSPVDRKSLGSSFNAGIRTYRELSETNLILPIR